MSTFAGTVSWYSPRTLRARLTDSDTGLAITEAAAAELTPRNYSWSVGYTTSATNLIYEVREVTTQDAAGFNAGANVDGPSDYEDETGGSTPGGSATPALGVTPIMFMWADGNGPANVTSMSLTSPAGVTPAFGVRRKDTQEIIVASGTALTNTATGVYQLVPDIIDAAPGLVYEVYRKVVLLSGAIDYELFYFDGSVEGDGPGHYSSTPVLQSLIGAANLDLYAALTTQGDPSEISARIQAALTDSDSRVNVRFAQNNSTVPDTTSVYYSRFAIAAGWYAVAYLYRARSLNDENGRAYLQQWESFADKELDDICWALSRDGSVAGPTIVRPSPTNGVCYTPIWAGYF